MEEQERRLVLRAQQGDVTAFEVLVEMHAPFVYNLALRILRDPQEAEDRSQEAFVRAWGALPRFRAQSRFRTWLCRIVVHVCFDRRPKLKAEMDALGTDEAIDLPDERQQVEVDILSSELRAHLHAAIEALPDSYRLLITLRHLQEMSYAEIADVTRLPLGTVKTGIHRARGLLRKALEEYEAAYA